MASIREIYMRVLTAEVLKWERDWFRRVTKAANQKAKPK